jgi:hypothetical protein
MRFAAKPRRSMGFSHRRTAWGHRNCDNAAIPILGYDSKNEWLEEFRFLSEQSLPL